jgi:hypothetical protein
MPPRQIILLIGDFVPEKLVELTPCGHRSEKKQHLVKTKFETAMPTVEETLFASRKTK